MKKHNVLKEMVELANRMDANNLFAESDRLDRIIKKIAWDADDPDEGPADWYDHDSPMIPDTDLKVGMPVMLTDDIGQSKQVGIISFVAQDTITSWGYASGPAIDPPEIDHAVFNITVTLTDTSVNIKEVDEFIKEHVSNYEDMEKTISGNDVEYTFIGGVVGKRPATYERIR